MRIIRLIILATILFSWPSYNGGSIFTPTPVEATVSDITLTSCFVDDASNGSCLTAITADAGSTFAIGKGSHIDAQFSTLSSSSVNSATLYYDNSGTLSGSWAVYVTDTRDGTTLCSVSPAPENGSETTNNLGCTISAAQLEAGVWLRMVNNDDKSPESITLDYIRITVDYNAALSISITTDGIVNFGTNALNSTVDTTASGLNDPETVQVDVGPGDLDIKALNFTGGTTWNLSTSNGTDTVHFEYSNDGSSWNDFAASDTYYTFDTNVAQSATRNVYLRLTLPTSTSSFVLHSTTITVLVSAP